ncbi:hypothetical protein TNCV_3473071 [Trichonephila clavipes]|nr:hypothetical protein TNCV_3473071 [Trichonephila clavipes]
MKLDEIHLFFNKKRITDEGAKELTSNKQFEICNYKSNRLVVRIERRKKNSSGRGSLVVKESDRGWLVTSLSPTPLKTRRVAVEPQVSHKVGRRDEAPDHPFSLKIGVEPVECYLTSTADGFRGSRSDTIRQVKRRHEKHITNTTNSDADMTATYKSIPCLLLRSQLFIALIVRKPSNPMISD